MTLKVAFDIGGVLSKYPKIFKPMARDLHEKDWDVHIITDMHDRDKILALLDMNGLSWVLPQYVHSADYDTYGEMCKAVLLMKLMIDLVFDDFPGYLTAGCPVRCHVLPDPYHPYWADDWKTDPADGEFGRRVSPQGVLSGGPLYALAFDRNRCTSTYGLSQCYLVKGDHKEHHDCFTSERWPADP